MEAALENGWTGCTRQVERLERHVTISNEAIALFVRFWSDGNVTCTADAALPAAQAKGESATNGLSRPLGRRLARGQSLAQEISLDAAAGTANHRASPVRLRLTDLFYCYAKLRSTCCSA